MEIFLRMKWARPHVLVVMLVVLALTLACQTNPETGETEPNWPVISVELGLLQQDLYELADLAEPEAPEVAEQLRELAGYAEIVKRGVDAYIAGGGPQGEEVFAAIDAALELADLLLDDYEDRVYVAAARMLARRVRAYLPQDT